MAFLLLILAFVSLFYVTASIHKADWRANVMIATIIFSTLCLILTEGLSLFKALNYSYLTGSWGLITFFLGGLIYKNRKIGYSPFKDLAIGFKAATLFEKRIGYFLITLAAFIFFQGLFYPPNNWDSLSYHMPRVLHWISNETVAHYVAQDYRQIHQSPFGEFLITHFHILSGSNLFDNSVQWLFLIFLMVGGSLLAKELGLNRKYQLITAFFIITIPQVIIQASSTKNDLVAVFFIIATCWFMLSFVKKQSFTNFLLIGLATGLAMLTKTTAYLFLFPILSCFAYWLIKNSITTKNWSNFGMAIPIALIVILINTGHFYRNYELSGNILGTSTTGENGYSINPINLPNIFSNVIRNISLHIAPYPLSQANEWTVKQLHQLLDIDVNNPQTTFGYTKYKITNYPNGEGDSPHLLHLIFLVIALFYALKKSTRKSGNLLIPILAGIVISQFLLFCFYLKWQPWHTRLHLPVFVLGCPLIVTYFHQYHKKTIQNFILSGFALYAIAILLFNSARPYIPVPNVTGDITIFDNRYKKLFLAYPFLEPDYRTITEIFKKEDFENVVFLTKIELEYALKSELLQGKIKAYNLNVNNYSELVAQNLPETPDCLISTKKEDNINFQNQEYALLNPSSAHLFIYGRKNTE